MQFMRDVCTLAAINIMFWSAIPGCLTHDHAIHYSFVSLEPGYETAVFSFLRNQPGNKQPTSEEHHPDLDNSQKKRLKRSPETVPRQRGVKLQALRFERHFQIALHLS